MWYTILSLKKKSKEDTEKSTSVKENKKDSGHLNIITLVIKIHICATTFANSLTWMFVSRKLKYNLGRKVSDYVSSVEHLVYKHGWKFSKLDCQGSDNRKHDSGNWMAKCTTVHNFNRNNFSKGSYGICLRKMQQDVCICVYATIFNVSVCVSLCICQDTFRTHVEDKEQHVTSISYSSSETRLLLSTAWCERLIGRQASRESPGSSCHLLIATIWNYWCLC